MQLPGERHEKSTTLKSPRFFRIDRIVLQSDLPIILPLLVDRMPVDSYVRYIFRTLGFVGRQISAD